MADKCFCHFNGYEVKDATARNDIAELKREKTTTFIIHNNLGGRGGYYYGDLHSKTLTIKPIVEGSVQNSQHIEIVAGGTATVTVPVGTLVLGYTHAEFPYGIKVHPTDRGNGDAYSWESTDGTLTLFADSEGTREYDVDYWELSNVRRPKTKVTLHNKLTAYETPVSSGTINYLVYDPMETAKVSEAKLTIGKDVTLNVHAGSLIVVRPSNNYPKWIGTGENLYSVATPDTLFIKIPSHDTLGGPLTISIVEKTVTTAQERVRLEEEARIEADNDLYNQFSSLETENVSLRNSIANLTYQIDLLKTRVTTLEEDAYDGGQSGEPGDDGVTVIVPIYNRTNASATVKYYDQYGAEQTETVANGTGNQKSVYAKIGTDLTINGSGIASITAPFEITSFSATSVKMSVHQTGVIANDVVIYSDDSGDYPPKSEELETVEFLVINHANDSGDVTVTYTDGSGSMVSESVAYGDSEALAINPAINTEIEVSDSSGSIRGTVGFGYELKDLTTTSVSATVVKDDTAEALGIAVIRAEELNQSYNQIDSTGSIANVVDYYVEGDGEAVPVNVGVMGGLSASVQYTDESGGSETLALDPGDEETIYVQSDTQVIITVPKSNAVSRVTAQGMVCEELGGGVAEDIYYLYVHSVPSDINTEILVVAETI